MIESTPRIITGVAPFTGRGLGRPVPIDGIAPYTVPPDRRAQLIYLRAGNSSDALATVVLMRDGAPMRLFPVGARAGIHVPLAVIEDLHPDTVLALHVAADENVSGHVVIDMGVMEV